MGDLKFMNVYRAQFVMMKPVFEGDQTTDVIETRRLVASCFHEAVTLAETILPYLKIGRPLEYYFAVRDITMVYENVLVA